MADYHINIFFSEEDGGYIADIPEPEACSAFGDTAEEAVREVETAKDAWLAAAREAPPLSPKERPPLSLTYDSSMVTDQHRRVLALLEDMEDRSGPIEPDVMAQVRREWPADDPDPELSAGSAPREPRPS